MSAPSHTCRAHRLLPRRLFKSVRVGLRSLALHAADSNALETMLRAAHKLVCKLGADDRPLPVQRSE
jgi:hypothetical protein